MSIGAAAAAAAAECMLLLLLLLLSALSRAAHTRGRVSCAAEQTMNYNALLKEGRVYDSDTSHIAPAFGAQRDQAILAGRGACRCTSPF